MNKNELGEFLRWLILKKKVRNKGDFADKTDINRTYLHSIIKGEGTLSDVLSGKVLSVYGQEYHDYIKGRVVEDVGYRLVSEETQDYNTCKKCAAKDAEIERLKNRILELDEMIQLFRENKRQNNERKRAV